jgi:predicted AAA+ superfamily ATPase
MISRPKWQSKIEQAWGRKSVLWLMGVRRVGKTYLCKSLPDVEYFDCELPRIRRQMEDPESFLKGLRNKRIILDEIHRLPNPSELLKITADHYPSTSVLATGSSTLGASARFRDTLTGRKEEIWLTPMNLADLDAFGRTDLEYRLHRGGMPPFFLSKELPEAEFQEWIDAYWAKDILELFRLEKRNSFQRFVELLLAQSGGIFEATRFATPCEVSRTTISNYLSVLEATLVMHVVRPFSKGGLSEIISAPKVYGFDTGFVCYHRGWNQIRREDLGILWEHFVLNELHGFLSTRRIHYWRSKHGNEVDLVVSGRGAAPIAIECKWSANDFNPRNVKAFRNRYEEGLNLVVSADIERTFNKKFGKLDVRFVGLPDLRREAF